jgi:hypothetical protein
MPVCAEVMDKEPTVAENWAWALVGGALARLAWRRRWWTGIVVSRLSLLGIAIIARTVCNIAG